MTLGREVKVIKNIKDLALEQMNDSIVVCGLDKKVLFANKNAREQLGDLVHHVCSSYISGWGAQKYKADGSTPFENNELPMNLALSGKSFIDVEMVISFPDKDPVWVSIAGGPVKEGDTIVGGAISFRNLSHRKNKFFHLELVSDELELKKEHLETAAKKLNEKNKELEDFAHIVSHDLKSPLRGIHVLVDWTLSDYREALEGEGVENLELIRERVKSLETLIEGILHYARVDHLGDNFEPVELNPLLEEVVKLLGFPKNSQIDIEDNLPSIMGVDPGIRMIFHNIFSNAIKYNDKDQIKITVQCLEKKSGLAIIKVTDNGKGIDEKNLSKMFNLFETLGETSPSSTGLGLALVRKVVLRHEGEIWAESVLGESTTFFIKLKIEVVEEPEL